jgi:hypothetical protein
MIAAGASAFLLRGRQRRSTDYLQLHFVSGTGELAILCGA